MPTRDREDFRTDWNGGAEPERELDDREQADAPEREDEDPEGRRLKAAIRLDELVAERDELIDRVQKLEDRIECLNDEIGYLEDELEE